MYRCAPRSNYQNWCHNLFSRRCYFEAWTKERLFGRCCYPPASAGRITMMLLRAQVGGLEHLHLSYAIL